MSKNIRLKYFILINGDIKEWHESFRNAVKAAEYYANNIKYYGYADIEVCQVLLSNGEEVR